MSAIEYSFMMGFPHNARPTAPLFDYYGHALSFAPKSYYLSKYKELPSNYSAQELKHEFATWFYSSVKSEILFKSELSNKNGIVKNGVWYSLPDYKAVIRINYDTLKDVEKYNIDLYYSEKKSKGIRLLIHDIHRFYVPPPETKGNKISLIVDEGHGLTTMEFEIKIGEIDIPSSYGSDFIPIYSKVIERLNTKGDKGIVLFHGVPGTGKTSVIKYIAKNLTKEVIFIPPNMTEAVCSPNFLPFLLNHKNSVLIIEDAEKIIADRTSKFSSDGVANLLNVSDGILGDCLNIQIIATFNTQKSNIDQALLRKGRLIAEHEFKSLSVSESNNLLSMLGKDFVTDRGMTLTEIYNLDEQEFKEKDKRESIGFINYNTN